MARDWAPVRDAYIRGTPVGELVQRFPEFSRSAIEARASREGWGAERRAVAERASAGAAEVLAAEREHRIDAAAADLVPELAELQREAYAAWKVVLARGIELAPKAKGGAGLKDVAVAIQRATEGMLRAGGHPVGGRGGGVPAGPGGKGAVDDALDRALADVDGRADLPTPGDAHPPLAP